MSLNILQNNWKEAKTQLKQEWSKLTDKDLDSIENNSEELYSTLQKYYSYGKEEVKTLVNDFMKNMKEDGS